MKNTSVLIVEDEAIVAKDIQLSLKKLGYDVVGTAQTSEKAIELAMNLTPDVILMDIMLKGEVNGIETAQEIMKTKSIPIIFLTAYADDDTLLKAKFVQPYGYIIKPFKAIDVHTSIQIAIYKHEKSEEIIKERDALYSLVENKDKYPVDFIFVKASNKLVRINFSDIYFVEALKDYMVINTSIKRFTVHSTMKDIETRLGKKEFVRVHRSFIVRLDKISSIDLPNLFLEDEKYVIPIGGSYKDELIKRIGIV